VVQSQPMGHYAEADKRSTANGKWQAKPVFGYAEIIRRF
jgi:hypothetical protein